MNRLDQLVGEAQAETAARRARVPLAELELRAAEAPAARGFRAALLEGGLRVIAEMKAASPSAGRLAEDYHPGRIAAEYQRGGAAALSVLAQQTSFGGCPEHLQEASSAVSLPVMRKDFVTELYQVLEARAYGADAVLLIVAALPARDLRSLLAGIRDLGMDALVEVHAESELEAALAAGADLVGVNHRDLTTLQMDMGLTERLRPQIPRDVVLVAESGIRGRDDAQRLRGLDVDAILVGEALMRSPDPAGLIAELSVP